MCVRVRGVCDTHTHGHSHRDAVDSLLLQCVAVSTLSQCVAVSTVTLQQQTDAVDSFVCLDPLICNNSFMSHACGGVSHTHTRGYSHRAAVDSVVWHDSCICQT